MTLDRLVRWGGLGIVLALAVGAMVAAGAEPPRKTAHDLCARAVNRAVMCMRKEQQAGTPVTTTTSSTSLPPRASYEWRRCICEARP
jgi:hypothetical protein